MPGLSLPLEASTAAALAHIPGGWGLSLTDLSEHQLRARLWGYRRDTFDPACWQLPAPLATGIHQNLSKVLVGPADHVGSRGAVVGGGGSTWNKPQGVYRPVLGPACCCSVGRSRRPGAGGARVRSSGDHQDNGSILGAGLSWALLPPADGAGVPCDPDPHSRETWAAGLSALGLGPVFVDSRCVSGGGAGNMEGCSQGVTETVPLSRWPGPGPGAGSSQPLAICGPWFPWPRLGAFWLGGSVSGLRVCVSLPHCFCSTVPTGWCVCTFPHTVPWGSRAAVSSLGTALLWSLQSPSPSFISWAPGLLADNPRPQLGQWSCRICALRLRGSDGLGVSALARGSVPMDPVERRLLGSSVSWGAGLGLGLPTQPS